MESASVSEIRHCTSVENLYMMRMHNQLFRSDSEQSKNDSGNIDMSDAISVTMTPSTPSTHFSRLSGHHMGNRDSSLALMKTNTVMTVQNSG